MGPVKSAARNARDYRKDAASHLYVRHSQHIYKGRLPPMLQAVGVLNVDIDRHGSVKSVQWMRAPRHAPEVMQQIERMVKAAAPYPVLQHMSQVTYTDVWLWHQSGKFQLDTLTEGQD
jgi:protein TonB